MKSDVVKAGFTPLGFTLGLKRLRDKRLIGTREQTDYNGETYMCLFLHAEAWEWIEAHEDMFLIRVPNESSGFSGEDGIPF